MRLFKEIKSLQNFLQNERKKSSTIGFVPTMGALHQGHISLIKKSMAENPISVCSIFVNPSQFNNAEDLANYPRTIEEDIKKLVESGCPVLFLPHEKELFPKNEKLLDADFGLFTESFEGKFRPGHFSGMISVVKKFFDIILPDHSYFGQKDFQQCMVVKELIKKYALPVRLHICPIVREPDGLAKSSRNARLTPEERNTAVIIPQILFSIKETFHQIPTEDLISSSLRKLTAHSPMVKVDYLEVIDADTFKPTNRDTKTKAVAMIAAWCGNIRLIDNMILTD
ncbi:MAG: pantoate--beta-alanine ligase [Bacteroidia bacterium]